MSYPLSEDVTNEFIAKCLYRKARKSVESELYREFDPEGVHRALACKGKTLKHLWKKYNAAGEVEGKRPLNYRQYCRRYTNWLGNRNATFHIQRHPGINMELDYAGKALLLRDQHNPEIKTKVTVLVAALSYSQYFYAESTTCCDITNWIRANNNALAYFGGVTQTVPPDNCKVAATENKDWVAPALNRDFAAWAEHNGTVILLVEVRYPRWNPHVEDHGFWICTF